MQAPQVLAVSPAAGANNVLVTASVSVFFSEPVLQNSLPGALRLIDVASGQPVPARIEKVQEGVIATVFPDAPLLPTRDYRVEVSTAVLDLEGNALRQPFTSAFRTRALGTLVLVSTNNVSALVGETLPDPIRVRLLDSSGQPVKQATVVMTAKMGAGVFEPSGLRQLTLVTDDSGHAEVGFRLGGQVVTHTVKIAAVGFSTIPYFRAHALPLPPANLRVYSGNNQMGPPGTEATFPLIVEATDSGGNLIQGTTVTFRIKSGQASIQGFPERDAITNSSGLASVPVAFGATSGGVIVEASFTNMLGQAPVFNLTNVLPQPSSPTAIVGRVLDAQSLKPLKHVYVYLADAPSIWDWSDDAGAFRLLTSPGAHVVNVDGFESGEIDGKLYPVVAIPVNAVDGRDNDIGMPALLPPLEIDSFLDVSDVQGGTLTLRSNPLWKMYVAPGQARFANGGRTGRLYVASVPPDRIPMPPAGGKISRFFDTVQPLSVRFEPPAQVSFPNSDNLPPGTVTEIFTLSYSSGLFLKTGRGQVSEDGVVINSLTGEGITAGGWHQSPSPVPPPQTCFEATLNLGLGIVSATLTAFGRSATGAPVGEFFWYFILCNLPSNQGPVTPIVTITGPPNAGPPLPPGPPYAGPPNLPPPVQPPPRPPQPPEPPENSKPVVTGVSLSLSAEEAQPGEFVWVTATVSFSDPQAKKERVVVTIEDVPEDLVDLTGGALSSINVTTNAQGIAKFPAYVRVTAPTNVDVTFRPTIKEGLNPGISLAATLLLVETLLRIRPQYEIDTSAVLALVNNEAEAFQLTAYLNGIRGRVYISTQAVAELNGSAAAFAVLAAFQITGPVHRQNEAILQAARAAGFKPGDSLIAASAIEHRRWVITKDGDYIRQQRVAALKPLGYKVVFFNLGDLPRPF